MILTLAIPIGLALGMLWARMNSNPYQPPVLKNIWLVFIAVLPQLLLIYISGSFRNIPDVLVAILLAASQIILVAFAWLNHKHFGMELLLIGAALNLAVMTANRGFMPISPHTASHLVSQEVLDGIPVNSRFGAKDILLHPEQTRIEWLSDRYLPPAWFPYQVAFSLGDVLIAIGVFLLLAWQKPFATLQAERITT